MAPNTQEEPVKTCPSDIEAKDRLKLKADGYLWQKVNQKLVHQSPISAGSFNLIIGRQNTVYLIRRI